MKSNRRSFLKSVSLGMAGLGSAGLDTMGKGLPGAPSDRLGNVDERKGIELAIATICMDGFGDEDFGPTFKLAPQIGIKNIEFNVWYPRNITLAGIESIRRRCYESGLTPISLQGTSFGGRVVKDVSHKLWLMEQAKSLGCRRVKFTGAKRGESGGLETVIEILNELAPAAEEMDVLVLVENHANNNIETVEDYDRIFDAIPSKACGHVFGHGAF